MKIVTPLMLFPLCTKAPKRTVCYQHTKSPLRTAQEVLQEARVALHGYTPTEAQRETVEALIHTIDNEIVACILSGDTDLDPPRPH